MDMCVDLGPEISLVYAYTSNCSYYIHIPPGFAAISGFSA